MQRSVIIMKIAVTCENGKFFQHLGNTLYFFFFDVPYVKLLSAFEIPPTYGGHGALAGFLKAHGTDALICGGIGAGAKSALADEGISLYPGVSGGCEDAVKALLDGSLKYQPDIQCAHKHDESHGCGHNCGEDKHGCGGNK